jgi:hypothetical protein
VKNAAFLMYCLGIALPIVTVAFLLEQAPRSERLAVKTSLSAPDNIASELEKTQASLRRLKKSPPFLARTRRIENAPEWFPLSEPEISTAVAPAPIRAVSAPIPAVASAPILATASVPIPLAAQSAALSGSPETFPSAWVDPRLSFLFFSQDFRRAVIDGRLAREGDLLANGVLLVAIHDTSIVVRKDGKRHRIDIPAVFPKPPVRMRKP